MNMEYENFIREVCKEEAKGIVLSGKVDIIADHPKHYSDYSSDHVYVLDCSNYLRTGIIKVNTDLEADVTPTFLRSGNFRFTPQLFDMVVVLSRPKNTLRDYVYMRDGMYRLDMFRGGRPLLLRDDTPFYKDFLVALQKCKDHFVDVVECIDNRQKLYVEEGLTAKGVLFFGAEVDKIKIKGDFKHTFCKDDTLVMGVIHDNAVARPVEGERHVNVQTNDLVYNLERYKTFIRISLGRLLHGNLERVLQLDIDPFVMSLDLTNCLMSTKEKMIISTAYTVLKKYHTTPVNSRVPYLNFE